MHHTILGAGACLLGLAGTALAAPPARPTACPAARAPVHEAFVAADCEACWAQAGPARPGWRLDWITPAGPQAAMASAALPEAVDRQARVQAGSATATATATATDSVTTTASTTAMASATGPGTAAAGPTRQSTWPSGWRLAAGSGPAWQGYLGLDLQLRPQAGARPLPPGSTGWLALVEDVPAGSDGSAQARTLVRALAGPLPLDARQPSAHLRAMRMPETSRPERLAVRAWVESATGQVLAMAADRCPPP